MNNPRRNTDLDNDDIDCLIKLCDTRMHTLNMHIHKNSFSDNTPYIKAAAQIQRTNMKLKKLKERNRY